MTSATTSVWRAPAKLNLFLHITGRRDDGYHLLQTVFLFLDQADELRFTPITEERICCEYQLPGLRSEDDIVYRAAQLLWPRRRRTGGVRIELDKKLPMGGGLGGGSSDAATTLLALNRLWDCRLSLDELAALGLSLGADVPVFVQGRACWAEGVGERMEAVQLPEDWYVVLIPQINVSTAELFADSQLNRSCTPITIRDFLAGRAGNVFEPVVTARYPQVAQALKDLGQHAEARLTGTGACVFARFDSQQDAQQAWSHLAKHWSGFVAQGQNRSAGHTPVESGSASQR